MEIKHYVLISVFVVSLLIIGLLSGSLFEINNEGYYHVKQSITGNMSVIDKAGPYYQGLGKITEYELCDAVYFSKHKSDGGTNELASPVTVRFNDGGTAEVSGMIKYCAPSSEEQKLLLHKEFKNHNAIKYDLIRQVVYEALKQTATLMTAEDSYSIKRGEFTAKSEEQVINGIYATTSKEIKVKDVDGNELTEKINELKKDKNGTPIIRKESPLKQYGIRVTQFIIKDLDFDKTIDKLIAQKKQAQQMKVVAKANAEKAKQDAITAFEQGKAEVARAKAIEEVEKIKEVTKARKELEVAQLNKEKTDVETKAMLLKKEREAQANTLLVKAGLTPKEKAEFDMKTAIGIAEKMSKINLPKMMIFGGGSNNPTDPFQAVGLETFMKITDKINDK